MPYHACRGDCGTMAAIHADAFPARDAWSANVFELQLSLPGVIALLHPAGGMIVARAVADEAEILTLAVAHRARRTGVASALLRAAAGEARDKGARTLFLEVSVRNEAARTLYERLGFAVTGRRKKYYSDKSDALVLRLDLTPAAPALPDGSAIG